MDLHQEIERFQEYWFQEIESLKLSDAFEVLSVIQHYVATRKLSNSDEETLLVTLISTYLKPSTN